MVLDELPQGRSAETPPPDPGLRLRPVDDLPALADRGPGGQRAPEERLEAAAAPDAFLVKGLELKNFSHEYSYRDYCKKGREGFTFDQPGYYGPIRKSLRPEAQMPKSDSSNPNGGPSFQGPRYRPNWLAAILCFIVATYLFAALLNYSPNQSHFYSTGPGPKNWVGWMGADTVWVLFYSIGASTFLLVPALYWMFYVAIRNSRHLVGTRVMAIVIGIVSMQVYDWMERYSSPLAAPGRYRDPLGRPIERGALEQLIRGIRDLGAVAQAYAPICAADEQFAEAHPQSRLYRNDGQPHSLGDLLQIMDPADPDWQRHWIESYGTAADTLGFNGFHLDTYGYPRCALDADGHAISVERGLCSLRP